MPQEPGGSSSNGQDWRERIDSFDRRIDRLAERHEALTQTVEIVAGMQLKNEEALAQVIDAIHRLARIAESHERRLDDLEGER